MSKRRIERIAVIGAGTMGAQIAAHFANVGLDVLLLDVASADPTPEERSKGLAAAHPSVRNRAARLGLERAQRTRPPAFFLPDSAGRIAVGNIEDDIERLSGADWIVEAVLEDLAVKRAVLERIDTHRRPGALVTTNTSGLSVTAMAAGRSDDLRAHFLGAHFFNPPRYMRLLEVIPTPDTSPEVLDFVRDFGDRVLGKGVVVCRDTPGFIGNRIGVFVVMDALHRALSEGLTFEEADLLTGPLMGRPRSGTFRLCDLIGLDVLSFVARHLHEHLPHDPARETFAVPPLLQTLLEKGWLGDKRGQGFYKRAGRDILTLDPETVDYRPRRKVDLLANDLKALVLSDTPAGRFAWGHLSAALCYAASRAPEIADDLVRIDDAMRWGFNWAMGPFKLWDAVGVRTIADLLEREGRPLPGAAQDLLKSDHTSFYTRENGRRKYFTLSSCALRDLPTPPDVLILGDLRARGKTVGERRGAALLDLNDGVACLEIEGPFDPFDLDGIAVLPWALEVSGRDFEGLVITGPAGDFWRGDARHTLDSLIAEAKWEEIDRRVRAIQKAMEDLRRASIPTVVAVSGRTVGLGCATALMAGRVQALAETAMGFDELSVGTLPIGGGLIELLRRGVSGLPPGADPYPVVRQTFETTRTGRLSNNAVEARQMNLLRPVDGLTMNPDRLVADAKALTLRIAGRRPDLTDARIPVMGAPGLARLKLDLYLMRQAEALSESGASVGLQLATVLCGGALSGPQPAPRSYLLDLEREAFVNLCRMKRTYPPLPLS
ncbi:MAG: hypothetical protein A3F84_10115 [Candidatus Handelsmanbacteria bacterium RIFCSPLOWO2_12_FULL_64_10]|uniref:Uncharacterized protein n=1 Tax=Handelsmanbacteria sp. (strain RIFCSPLOWO2_12_FULL_64_10) TaxID=1817868 RepID=A0A1F6D4B6_HANXR|nr:MAG: hypothetical protein A3F84_10115 [Candidatus Handelsmanbacteria bacterium RIFCSPLOWO2_12_FULL_64_10]